MSGRVRDGGAKQLLAKQLQGLQAGLPEFLNLSTGQIRAKKAKKEKTREEEAMFEMKKCLRSFFDQQICFYSLPSCVDSRSLSMDGGATIHLAS